MTKLKDESFQAVSRGLLAHLPEMTSNQAKLYLYCLLRAKNKGDKKGTFTGFAVDIAGGVGWTIKVLYRVLKSMTEYLKVKYSQNRHHPLTIKIAKFKALPDFYSRNSYHGIEDGNGDSKWKVSGQLVDSNPRNPKKEKDLKSAKKEIKGEKVDKRVKKHSFPHSPFYDKKKFAEALKDWPQEKLRHYYQAAYDYSEANGGRYINWILAVQNWSRKDETKGKIPWRKPLGGSVPVYVPPVVEDPASPEEIAELFKKAKINTI